MDIWFPPGKEIKTLCSFSVGLKFITCKVTDYSTWYQQWKYWISIELGNLNTFGWKSAHTNLYEGYIVEQSGDGRKYTKSAFIYVSFWVLINYWGGSCILETGVLSTASRRPNSWLQIISDLHTVMVVLHQFVLRCVWFISWPFHPLQIVCLMLLSLLICKLHIRNGS